MTENATTPRRHSAGQVASGTRERSRVPTNTLGSVTETAQPGAHSAREARPSATAGRQRSGRGRANDAVDARPPTRTAAPETQPANAITRYGIVDELRAAGVKVEETEVCHLHLTWAEAQACEQGRTPWYREHDLIEIRRDSTGGWIVTESASDARARRA